MQLNVINSKIFKSLFTCVPEPEAFFFIIQLILQSNLMIFCQSAEIREFLVLWQSCRVVESHFVLLSVFHFELCSFTFFFLFTKFSLLSQSYTGSSWVLTLNTSASCGSAHSSDVQKIVVLSPCTYL